MTSYQFSFFKQRSAATEVSDCLARDHRLLHLQTRKIPGVMKTSPLGPISPLWAPARAASPAASRSGKRGLRGAWPWGQVPTRKEEVAQPPPPANSLIEDHSVRGPGWHPAGAKGGGVLPSPAHPGPFVSSLLGRKRRRWPQHRLEPLKP